MRYDIVSTTDYLHAIYPVRDLVLISKVVPPVVDAWAQWTNRLSQWVVSEVVLTSNPKQRIALIKRLYIIADVCRSTCHAYQPHPTTSNSSK